MLQIEREKIYSAREVSKMFKVTIRTVQRIAHRMKKKKGFTDTLYFSGDELRRIAVGR